MLVEGDFNGPRHTFIDFGAGLLGQDLLLTIDSSNLAGTLQDNIGIDNVRFGQTPPPPGGNPGAGDPVPVPEPGSMALFASALGLMMLRTKTASQLARASGAQRGRSLVW